MCLCLACLLFLATSVESRMQNAKYKCVCERVFHACTTYLDRS
jgi:hypothetical protein